MFRRKKIEEEQHERRAKYMSNSLAHELAQVAYEAMIASINFRNSSGSLDILGASVTITIQLAGINSCEIQGGGICREFKIPSMDERDYAALTEAVGFIIAPSVEKYLRDKMHILYPHVEIYTDHVHLFQAATCVVYGELDDDSLIRIR